MTEPESFSLGLFELEDDQGPLVAIGEYFRTVGCLLSDQMELFREVLGPPSPSRR